MRVGSLLIEKETAMTAIPRNNLRSLRSEIGSTTHRVKLARSQTPQSEFGRVFIATWVAIVFLLGAMPAFLTMPQRQRAIEATAQMEQFTNTLSRAKTIAPETAHRIGEIIRRPEYDCMQVTCDAALETRNRTARESLQSLLSLRMARPPAPISDPDQIEQASVMKK
jgi:hypothetical protein